MIAIIKGCGTNIASIQCALNRLGASSKLTADSAEIKSASHVILPGVGSAPKAMFNLKQLNILNSLKQLKQPVLGICLGMQILFEHSAEGDVSGLDIMKGTIVSLKNQDTCVPHMGWNQINIQQSSGLLKAIPDKSYFYFVHSFAAPVSEVTCCVTRYGMHFSSIVQKDNFYGTQFHPEKSGKIGEQLLKNFLEL